MNEENNNSISLNLAAPTENGARLDLLYEIGRILASQETMNEAAPQILEAICRHLRFEIGELWCLGKDDAALHLDSVWHLPGAPLLEKFAAASRQFAFPVGEGLPGKVWAKNAPVWIENLGGEDQIPRRLFAEETGLQSGFAFPILLGDKFLGAFSFFSRARRQPDDALLQMFAAVGSHIGQFVKREKVESSLRESEDRYRAFIKQSTEGIWRFELDEKFSVNLPVEEQVKLSFERGFLAECNDAMARMYNLERAEDLVGARLADMLDASDAANVEYIRSFVESGYHLTDAESHEKDADGNDKYFLNSLVGTIENGYLLRVWGTQRDITEQKRADQSLVDNEERYRALVEATSTVVWRANEGGELSFVGSSWEQVSGQKIEEILGAGWLDALHPDDRQKTVQIWQRALASKGIYETEFRVLTTGGEYRWFAVRGVPILNPDGSLREWVGANTDIDERRAAEERVRESETRFRQMADSAPVMIWVTDSDGSCSYLSQSWYQFTGQTPETALGFGWLDATHPDDSQRSGEIFLAANAKHEPFRLEYRLRRADGTYAWAIDSAQPRFNQDGEFLGYIGSVIDITERKIAEERVRQSEANFRQLAETVPQFVWVTETNGLLSYVNRQWVKFSGLTLADTNDPRKTATVFHPDDIERLNSEWERSFTSGEDLEIEIRIREAGGDYCWFLTRSRPVKDASGKITKWFGTSTDITDRKKAESRLALIAEVSELARTLEDPNQLLFKVSQAVGEHLQVKRCLFNEIDLEQDSETVHRDYCRGAESVAGVHRISDYSSITSTEMIRGKTVVNDDSKTDARTAKDYAKTYEPNGERAYIAVPLLRQNRWVASLWISTDEPRDWSAQEISLLETVAERTWTAVEKLRINRALRESEERYSGIVNQSVGGIAETDGSGRFKIVNDRYCEIVGYSREELMDLRMQEITHPEDLPRNLELVKKLAADGTPFEIEKRYVRSDGTTVWVHNSISSLRGANGELESLIAVSIDITNRKQAEEFLRESEERFRLLTENAEDYAIIFLDTDARITKWNVGAERILGWTEAEAVGRAGAIIFTPEDRAEGVPEKELTTAAEAGHAKDERWHLRRDGSRLFAFGEMIALYDDRENLRGYAKLFRDLTVRKQLDDALRDSEEKFRNLANSISQFAWMTDADGYIFWYNERWFEYTGTTLEEMQGWGWRAVHHPEHVERVTQKFKRHINSGEPWEDTFPLRGADGKYRWFLSRALPIRDDSGRVVRWFGTNTDITERKEIEAEREQLLASEQKAREIAEDANFAKDEFIALVSHELRSPLNAMLGWTRILQEQNPDEKTRAYALDVIVRNARSQSRLIEDLLDIARVGKGKLRLELQPTELIPIIETAVETVKPAAEAGKINFTQRLDRAANFITGDTDRLRQVIENLLSNAVKFTAPGGSVEIFLERENGNAKITISDTGQGISPEFLPQIFERFKQAESSTTRRHGGLGIGLSLARDLVELHGGTISAESRGEGKGATFTVTLPLRMIKPIKENSEKRVEDMDAQGKLSGFWILAVDDEADARELVSFMLQINGAKVTTANSAVEALEILKNADGRLPDILLSDISMPNESGYALLEKIRSLPREHGGQIPAVALTAFNRPEDREAAFEAGFQKHLGKPVESEDLISAIIETAGAK